MQQGRLGDCWVLCAISSMAEFPELIRAIFLKGEEKQAEQEAGLYTLSFCKNGMWQVKLSDLTCDLYLKIVRVDDYVPCVMNGGPVYSRGNGPELWVMLLEKAYAKVQYYFRRIGDSE